MNIKWEDKIPNIEVLRHAKMPSVETMILSAQLRWSGHVVRMDDSKLPKILLNGELRNGVRSVGGQKLRYKDSLKRSLKRANVAVEDWEALAGNRKEWRKIVHKSTEVIESKRVEEYENRRRARHGLLQSAISCNRCGRNFLSNAGLSSHVRANRC